VEHVFKDLKVSVTSEQNLETLECDSQTVDGVHEGDIVNFGKIGYHSLIVYTQFVFSRPTGICTAQLKIERSDQVGMLISRGKG
jgi:hypothetical protein